MNYFVYCCDSLGNYFNQTSVTLPLPAALGQLSALNALWLIGTGLTGTIPEALGSLSSLQQLSLVSFSPTLNFMSGTIPEFLGTLTSLSYLCAHPDLDSDAPRPAALSLQC